MVAGGVPMAHVPSREYVKDLHDHDIHDADQYDRNQHHLDEDGHQIQHLGNLGKGGKVFPAVQLKQRLAHRILLCRHHLAQALCNLVQCAELLQPDCHFTDLWLFHAQQFDGIIKMNIAVATARAGGTFQDAADPELFAVDRAVLVGGHNHHGIADFDVHAACQQLRYQNIPFFERFFSADDPVRQKRDRCDAFAINTDQALLFSMKLGTSAELDPDNSATPFPLSIFQFCQSVVYVHVGAASMAPLAFAGNLQLPA